MSRSCRLLLPGVLLGSTLVLALCIRAHHAHIPLFQPGGHDTAAQILDPVEPVCHRLFPRTDHLSLMAEPTLQGALHAYWSVTCSEAGGKPLADLTWDAATGQLCSVCLPPKSPGKTKGRLLTGPQAVRVARQWLETLGIALSDSPWQLLGAPRLKWNLWTVLWQMKDRRAEVKIHATTGDLQLVQNFHWNSIPLARSLLNR